MYIEKTLYVIGFFFMLAVLWIWNNALSKSWSQKEARAGVF